MNDLQLWELFPKSRGDVSIGKFGKFDESFKDWGGRGCHKFVPVFGGDKSKIVSRGDLCDQPSGEMS